MHLRCALQVTHHCMPHAVMQKNVCFIFLDHASEEIESVSYMGTDRRLIRRIAQSTLFDLAIYKVILKLTHISLATFYGKKTNCANQDKF